MDPAPLTVTNHSTGSQDCIDGCRFALVFPIVVAHFARFPGPPWSWCMSSDRLMVLKEGDPQRISQDPKQAIFVGFKGSIGLCQNHDFLIWRYLHGLGKSKHSRLQAVRLLEQVCRICSHYTSGEQSHFPSPRPGFLLGMHRFKPPTNRGCDYVAAVQFKSIGY